MIMEKKKVNFVVTDLDDTIWDWVKMWYHSFNPYLQRISKEFNIDIQILKASFKRLHEKYHTSESSFIYNDLDCLNDDQKKLFRTVNGDKSIIHEYNSNKKNNLFMYDGVFDTLQNMKRQGVFIVAFTESSSFYTKYRIKHLELDGIINCIYAPLDAGLPEHVIKVYSEEFWEPEKTEFRYLPRKVRKPDSEILEVILQDFMAKKETSIYIGDKLDRDVFMAQQLGITSVWAKYGLNIDDEEYALLREVTHWTAEDVEREKEFKKNFHSNPQPDFILEHDYQELEKYFDFSKFERKKFNCDE
jgi:HAD superfamily hydrolase (TIGR01662 family)